MKLDSVRVLVVGDTPVAAYTDPVEANNVMHSLRDNGDIKHHVVWCISVAVNPYKVDAVNGAINADRQAGDHA